MINLNMSKDLFFHSFFEKKFLFLEQSFDPQEPSFQDLNTLLFQYPVQEHLIRLFKNGLIPFQTYTESFMDIGIIHTKIIKDIFYKHLQDGATLVLNRIDTQLVLAHQIALEIGRFIGEKTVANGYFSIGGDGAFNNHWDTHDVFVVQLMGQKRWQIFEPTFSLPLPHQKSKNFPNLPAKNMVFDQVLKSGDTLYIPRGWWHNATPLDATETFHLAVGVHPPHTQDYFNWLYHHKMHEFLSFRESLMTHESTQVQLEKLSLAITDLAFAAKDPINLQKFHAERIKTDQIKTPFNLGYLKNSPLPEQNFRYNSHYSSTKTCNGLQMNIDNISSDLLEEIASSAEINAKNHELFLQKLTLMDIIQPVHNFK